MDAKEFLKMINGFETKRNYRINHLKNEVQLKCSKCSFWKDLNHFSKVNKPSLVIKFRSNCKSCEVKTVRKYYKEHEDKRKLRVQKDTVRKRERKLKN